MKNNTQEKNHAKEQAKAQLESIAKMISRLDHDNPQEGSDALDAIQEDPLSIEVRGPWFIPGNVGADTRPEEFNILLCTGGPAVRIMGILDNGEPTKAWIEYQDWGTPWTEYRLTSDEEETVLAYCRCFYFGE